MDKWIGRLLLLFIWIYRRLISPWLTPQCRFLPTCSEYAIDAINNSGPWRGASLAIKRIGRCHPWGGSGVDPAPKINHK